MAGLAGGPVGPVMPLFAPRANLVSAVRGYSFGPSDPLAAAGVRRLLLRRRSIARAASLHSENGQRDTRAPLERSRRPAPSDAPRRTLTSPPACKGVNSSVERGVVPSPSTIPEVIAR